MKLYELSGAFNNIFDLLNDEDEINLETLEDTLQSIEGAIEHKVGSIAKMILSLEKQADGFASEAKRLSAKKKTIENKISWLKRYLLDTMTVTGKDKINTDIGTVARRKSPPSVMIGNEKEIPAQFYYQPDPVLDKKLILDHLKKGQDVPGAEIKQGHHIRIY